MTPEVDWLLVFTNLASGAWTWEQATAATGLSKTIIEAQIFAARTAGRVNPRLADLAVRIIARHGLTAAAETGGATLILGLSTVAWALLGAGIVALGVGGYIYSRGETPINPGPTMGGVHKRNVDDPVKQRKSSEPYGVFIGGGYNEVIVGQESVILEANTTTLVGWGTDSTKKVKDTGATFKMILGPFKTAEEARQAFDANKVPDSERIKPFASGKSARFKFDGKEHDIDNAFRLLE